MAYNQEYLEGTIVMRKKDFLAGLAMIAIGVFVVFYATLCLRLGSAHRMGPGYFPTILGSILAFLGTIILVQAHRSQAAPFGHVPWRGIILISAAPISFGLVVKTFGLAPGVALASLLATLASREVKLPVALLIGVGLVAFSVLVFSLGLGLAIPVIGNWYIR